MADKKMGKVYTRTSLHGGHIAGHGCIEDDYSETSGCKYYEKKGLVRFPHDKIQPESLNGEVIIVQKGRKTEAIDEIDFDYGAED